MNLSNQKTDKYSDIENYTGWIKWRPTNDEWLILSTYSGNVEIKKLKQSNPEIALPDLEENQYLLIYDTLDGKKKLRAQYKRKGDYLIRVGHGSIKYSFSDFKTDENGNVKKTNKKVTTELSPINDEQVTAFDLLNDDDITFKLISGNYGSGKTLLTSAKAVEMLTSQKVKKIVWVRNVVKAKDTEDVGYLPGDLLAKIRPWIMPLIDNLKSESAVLHMIENNQLEVVLLSDIRGRSFDDTVVVSTESQNLTQSTMKLLTGRIGKNSYLLVEGDFTQTDRKIFDESPGMKAAVHYLKGDPLFGYVDLPTDERSETARLADKFKDE